MRKAFRSSPIEFVDPDGMPIIGEVWAADYGAERLTPRVVRLTPLAAIHVYYVGITRVGDPLDTATWQMPWMVSLMTTAGVRRWWCESRQAAYRLVATIKRATRKELAIRVVKAAAMFAVWVSLCLVWPTPLRAAGLVVGVAAGLGLGETIGAVLRAPAERAKGGFGAEGCFEKR